MGHGRGRAPADSIAAVRVALDAGVNFFDTAQGYGDGHAERVLGRALVGRQREAVIASKVSRAHLSAEGVQRACERSLRLLQTDTINLYQVHWPSRTIPLDETMRALERLHEQGKVRAIGVRDLADLLEVGWVDTDQLPYSLLSSCLIPSVSR